MRTRLRKGASALARYGGFIFGLVLLIAVIGIARHLGEGERFAALLARSEPVWLVLAFGLQFGTYPANAAMWEATLSRVRPRVPFARLMKLSVAKLFLDQVAPSAGLSGSLMVTESLSAVNVSRPTAVRALLVGLTGYYMAYASFFLLALAYLVAFASVNYFVLITAIVFGAVVLILAVLVLLFLFGDLASHLPRFISELPTLKPSITALKEAPAHLSRDWGILLEAALAAGVLFVFDIFTLWAVARSLHLGLTPGQALAGFMIPAAAGTIALIPGGLGVYEGASTGMLVFFGVPFEGAVTATLILRGLTYWLPMLPGLFILRHEIRAHQSAAEA